jgi:hypothetical protein
MSDYIAKERLGLELVQLKRVGVLEKMKNVEER